MIYRRHDRLVRRDHGLAPMRDPQLIFTTMYIPTLFAYSI